MAGRFDEEAVEWMIRTGFRKKGSWLTHIKAGWFTGRCMPYCLDRCGGGITWLMYWGGGWDDDLDDDPRLSDPGHLAVHIAKLKRVLTAPEAPVDATDPYRIYLSTLRDIRIEIGAHATPAQMNYLITGLGKYLDAVLWKTANQKRRQMPSLADYLVMRQADVAGPWMTALTPIGGGYELSADEVQDRRVRAISEVVGLIVGLDNDIISFHREMGNGLFRQHIIDVLMHERGCSMAEALDAAVKIRDRLMCLYLRLRDQIAENASPGLSRYVHDIGYWIRGNIEWSRDTHRYLNPIDAATKTEKHYQPFDLTWADKPADDDPDPLPVPAIAWWWES